VRGSIALDSTGGVSLIDGSPTLGGSVMIAASSLAYDPHSFRLGGLAAVVPAKEFKRRMVVEIDGAPHMIEHIQVQSPSARGAATLYKVRARNLKTRNRVEKSYKGTEGLSESSFERRAVQYLYRDPDGFHFMDSTDFNQFSLKAEDLEDFAPFMTENMEGVEALLVDEEVIGIEIPDTVELDIVDTAPGVRGNSATGRTKPATLSTGHVIQVPEHLDSNVKVRVNTETGEYLGRAN
jgi:elongation factor P